MDAHLTAHRLDSIHKDIFSLDHDTGDRMQVVKAFYLKGLTSELDNGMLVDALSRIHLDLIALRINASAQDLTDATMKAREEGKNYGQAYVK